IPLEYVYLEKCTCVAEEVTHAKMDRDLNMQKWTQTAAD
nr:hypothetical protein [Tanacetum cinerariifolium]